MWRYTITRTPKSVGIPTYVLMTEKHIWIFKYFDLYDCRTNKKPNYDSALILNPIIT